MAEAVRNGLRLRPSDRAFAVAEDPWLLAGQIRHCRQLRGDRCRAGGLSRPSSPALRAQRLCRRQCHDPAQGSGLSRRSDRRDEAAEAIGAVNTLWFEDGVLHGGNTDADGFAANLDDARRAGQNGRRCRRARRGGAARAVVHALKQRGVSDIRVVNRTRRARRRTGRRVSGPAFPRIPLEAADGTARRCRPAGQHHVAGDGWRCDSCPSIRRGLPDQAIVTDIVYVPLETPLLAAARARGLKTVDGLGMLLHQAVPGFERWFGKRPEVTRRAARR